MIFLILLLKALTVCQLVKGEENVDVTYNELVELDADCNTSDNCKYPPLQDRLDLRNCNCEKFCADFGTCCMDSPHRSSNRSSLQEEVECSKVYGTSTLHVFMINGCKQNWAGDPSISRQCAGDAEARSDPLLLVPVTSNQTGLTYRNYFCFRCNEEESHQRLPKFWQVKISGDSVQTVPSTVPVIQYDKTIKTWKMLDAVNKTFANISLSVEIPEHVKNDVRICRNGVVSSCATNWTDDVIRAKCSSYMGIIIISKNETNVPYRNAHCAICNHESLADMLCSDFVIAKAPKRPFSFTLLVDVNQSDGDEVGKVKRCDDQSVYDPFFKRCRILKCAMPNYTIVEGKCLEM
ncbi:uncharacterized protein LOC129228040 [Uloborus diversus]|uniref:uncharacterized protein LOC129228040 n=1 Tax=Uloborus diversus TaxID=327109 RepID=UPI00240A574F|nr:uncharacterized protein LOC129228040 [Uloborus diversus]XP_054718645.1 uncharacterized protein LOC129228040 [Uloborus diversus]